MTLGDVLVQAAVVVESGSLEGKRFALAPGQALKVGRVAPATLLIRDDSQLSNVHFELRCEPDGLHLTDLNSRFGTFVNDAPAVRHTLADGDCIRAGQTVFRVHLAGEGVPAAVAPPIVSPPPPVAPPPPVPTREGPRPPAAGPRPATPLSLLESYGDGLYAVLDAARDAHVRSFLVESELQHQILLDGAEAEELEAFGPYLVRLPAGSAALPVLVRYSWGQCWGVYLLDARPFAAVRAELMRRLIVKLDAGGEAYFRFYDPRVLRSYLPGCTPGQAREFFGPTRRFIAEAADGRGALEYEFKTTGIVATTVSVGVGGG